MNDPYGSAEAVLDSLNLAWEEPTTAKVGGYTYEIYIAKADTSFWATWRAHKYILREYGVDVSEEDGTYIVTLAINNTLVQALKMEKNSANIQPGPYNLHPDAEDILHEEQIPAAGTLLKVLQIEDFALDASEMGLGKTFHALAVAKTLDINFAVICPASAVTKWERTAWDFFGLEAEFVYSYQKLVRGRTHFLTKTEIPSRKKKKDRSWKWNTVDDVLLIWDEVQYCGGTDSQNSEMLDTALRNQHIKSIGLSATAADSPLGLKILGKALGLHRGHDFWSWCKDNGCQEAFFGGLEFVKNKQKQRYHQIKLHNAIYPKRGTRLLKSQLKDKLPDNILLAECIDVDFNPKAGYIKEALKHIDHLEEEDAEKETESFLTPVIRNRQRAEILKIPYLLEEALQAYQQGMSVIFFTNFKVSLEILKGQLKEYNPSIVVGGQTRKVRDQNLDAFQNNSTRHILANIDAGAEAIDLHDIDGRFPRFVLLCPMDKAKKMIQCLGRVDRTGKKSISTQKMVFARDTQEEDVYQNVCNKMDNIHLLNDGDLKEAANFKLQN